MNMNFWLCSAFTNSRIWFQESLQWLPCQSLSVFEPRGKEWNAKKKAPLPLSLATYMKHQCLQFIYPCYSGAGKICQTHKWHVCQREVIYVMNVCSQAKKQQSPILWKMLLQISQLCDRSLIKASSPKDRGIMWVQLFQITVENTAYILLGFDLWIYYTV